MLIGLKHVGAAGLVAVALGACEDEMQEPVERDGQLGGGALEQEEAREELRKLQEEVDTQNRGEGLIQPGDTSEAEELQPELPEPE